MGPVKKLAEYVPVTGVLDAGIIPGTYQGWIYGAIRLDLVGCIGCVAIGTGDPQDASICVCVGGEGGPGSKEIGEGRHFSSSADGGEFDQGHEVLHI